MSAANGVSVRWATPDDAGAIARIHCDAWRHNYRGLIADATLAALSVEARLEAWRREFERGARVMLAERDHQTMGWVCLGAFRHTATTRGEVISLTAGWAELMGFYVAPDAQRSGVGRSLWHAASAWCGESGYRDVGLWVLADNLPAIRFYGACGFRNQHLDQNFEINGQPLVETLMGRPLADRS